MEVTDGEFMNRLGGRPNDFRLNDIMLNFMIHTMSTFLFTAYFVWLKRLLMKELSLQILLCEEVIGNPDATADQLNASPRSTDEEKKPSINQPRKDSKKKNTNENVTFFQLRTVLLRGINPDDFFGKTLKMIQEAYVAMDLVIKTKEKQIELKQRINKFVCLKFLINE